MLNALLLALNIAWVQPVPTTDFPAEATTWEYAVALDDGTFTPFTRVDGVIWTHGGEFGNIYAGIIPTPLPGQIFLRACAPVVGCSDVHIPRYEGGTDPGSCGRADMNGDGVVGVPDFNIWKKWLGHACE